MVPEVKIHYPPKYCDQNKLKGGKDLFKTCWNGNSSFSCCMAYGMEYIRGSKCNSSELRKFADDFVKKNLKGTCNNSQLSRYVKDREACEKDHKDSPALAQLCRKGLKEVNYACHATWKRDQKNEKWNWEWIMGPPDNQIIHTIDHSDLQFKLHWEEHVKSMQSCTSEEECQNAVINYIKTCAITEVIGKEVVRKSFHEGANCP